MYKKYLILFVLVTLLYFIPGNTSANELTVSFDKANMDQIIVPISCSIDSIDTTTNSSGTLRLNDFKGIKLSADFTPISDNPIITLDSNGTWQTNESGNITIIPVISLTEDTIKKIEQKFPGKEIIIPMTQQTIPVNVANDFDNTAEDSINIPVNSLMEQRNETNVTERESLTVPLHYDVDKIDTSVNKTGKLKLKPFEGIELEVVFDEITDNESFSLDKQGNWKALSSGDILITPICTISDKSLRELELKFSDYEIIFPMSQQILPVSIKQNKQLTIPLILKNNKIEATTKAAGKLIAEPFEGIPLEVSFEEITDSSYITLDENGNWSANNIGKTTITPKMTLSEDSLKKIKEKFPDSDITVVEKPKTIDVTVKKSSLTERSKTKQNNIKKEATKIPIKKMGLPISLVSVSIISGSVFFFMLQKKNTKTNKK